MTIRTMEKRALIECIADAQGGLCSACGKPLLSGRRGRWGSHDGDPLRPSLDHVFPISRGGFDGRGNLVVAHAECNTAKSDHWPSPADLEILATVNRKMRWEAPAPPRAWVHFYTEEISELPPT